MTIGGISSFIDIIFVSFSFCLFVCLFYGTWEFLQPVQCCDMTCVSRWSHNSFPWSTGSRSQEIHRCSPLTQFSQDAFTITRFLGLQALPRFYVLKYLWEWHVWWIPFFYISINFDFVEMCCGAWVGACSKQMRSCTLACFLCHFVPNSNAQLERKSAAT